MWSGLIVSLALGAVATILIGRLAERWFGPAAGRRTIAVVCLFPGSIVFSMDYTERLLLTCVAGAMLAAEHRRWLLAGLLAAVATHVPINLNAIVGLLGTVLLACGLVYLWRARNSVPVVASVWTVASPCSRQRPTRCRRTRACCSAPSPC